MNKPIKCWDCLYLGKCSNCKEQGCERFVKWKYTYEEVAKLLNINTRTLFRWFELDRNKALIKIDNLIGYRFKLCYNENKNT